MALKPVKALGLLAVVIGTSGVAFQLFINNSSGALNRIMDFGGQSVEIMGGLFIVLGLAFLYHAFR